MKASLKPKSKFLNLLYQPSPHTKVIEDKIKQLQELEPDWDFGEGEAISNEVATASLKIAEDGLLLGLKANVRPSVDGGIVVSLFHNDRFLFVSVKCDNLFDVVYEKGIGVDYETVDSKENLNSKSIKEYISQWVLSEHYISVNMTRMQNVSPQIHLKNTKMAVFQYLTKSAPDKQAAIQYADTLNSSTIQQSATQYAFAE